MRIGIIGGGSIGMLFACYLSKRHLVTVYCRTASQADEINARNMRMKVQNDDESFSVHAKTSNVIEHEDLYIICVKQYQLESILPAIQHTSKDSILLFLQNGIAHLTYIKGLQHKQILLGVVEHGALKLSNTNVYHAGKGLTRLALFRGEEKFLHKIRDELTVDDFPFVVEDQYSEMLTRKLLVNAVINPLTALLKVRNGDLLINPFYYQLFHVFFSEVANILTIADHKKAFHYVEEVCRNTAANESSMFRDVTLGKQTEIDGIIGPLIQIAEEKSIQVPFLTAAYNAIKEKEKGDQ